MKLLIPESLADITVRQWLKYQKVKKTEDFTDEVDRLALVAIFCNITVKEALQIEAADFNQTVEHIREILKQEVHFIQRFTSGGKEFGFIPNLEMISQGELVDLDAYLADEETYPEAMAVMYRPIETKLKSWIKRLVNSNSKKSHDYYKKFLNLYNIEDYTDSHVERNKEDMLDASIEVMFGSQLFFYRLGSDLLRSVQSYLETMTQTMTAEEQAILTQSGAGISQFIQSLEAINLSLTKPQD